MTTTQAHGTHGLLWMFGVLIVSACASSPPAPPAQHPLALRAPFDLDCPKRRIRYRKLGPDTIGARGCGRRATYVKVCREILNKPTTFMTGIVMTETKCQWIMNTAR
jgi:hypothetical protein